MTTANGFTDLYLFVFAGILFFMNVVWGIVLDRIHFGRKFDAGALYKSIRRAGVGAVVIVIPGVYFFLTKKPFFVLLIVFAYFLGLLISHLLFYFYISRKKSETSSDRNLPPK